MATAEYEDVLQRARRLPLEERRQLREVLATLEEAQAPIRNGEQVATPSPIGTNSLISMREVVARLGDLTLPGDGFSADLEAVQSSQAKVGDPEWHS